MSALEQLPHRIKLLQTAIDITMGDRNKTHGDFMASLMVEAVMLKLYRTYAKGKYTPEHDTAMEMVIKKLVRIMMGSAHDDHYIDLSGYAVAAREAEVTFGGLRDS